MSERVVFVRRIATLMILLSCCVGLRFTLCRWTLGGGDGA